MPNYVEYSAGTSRTAPSHLCNLQSAGGVCRSLSPAGPKFLPTRSCSQRHPPGLEGRGAFPAGFRAVLSSESSRRQPLRWASFCPAHERRKRFIPRKSSDSGSRKCATRPPDFNTPPEKSSQSGQTCRQGTSGRARSADSAGRRGTGILISSTHRDGLAGTRSRFHWDSIAGGRNQTQAPPSQGKGQIRGSAERRHDRPGTFRSPCGAG